jgi:hypothetical protein
VKDRLLAALTLGGAATLLLEIRFEHREALSEEWAAWIPLVYCALLTIAGGIALARWRSWGRPALGALFACGLAVGLCGVWFHSDGHPIAAFGNLLAAWRGIKVPRSHGPPPLAPLAFCGLGAIGTVVCFGPQNMEAPGGGDGSHSSAK